MDCSAGAIHDLPLASLHPFSSLKASWCAASHWDTLWLAPPYALLPWMAGPVGSARPQWVCLLLFLEWLQWLCFALCWASADWTMTGLWDQTIVNDTEYHTLTQKEQMTLFDAFCSHGFQHRQSFLAPEFWFDLRLVHQHSVEVDPKVSEAVHAFYDFSIEGDCWHCLSDCFVVEGAPQGLCLAWIEFRLCLLAPLWYFFQLLLDSGDCCVGVTGCFEDKSIIYKQKPSGLNHCSDPPVPLCNHCRGLGTGGSLAEDPLSIVGALRSSFQVTWQPFFPGVLLWAILWATSWRHIVQVPSAVWTALCCTHLQINCYSQSLFLPLESHIDIVWEAACVFPSDCTCSVPSLVRGKYVFAF